MSRLENGLSFAETIFWGHGFRKTSADSLFLNSAGFSLQILPAERGLGNECGQNLNSFWKSFGTSALYCTLAIQCKFFYYVYMESGKKLGKNLKMLRLKRKLSQGELSKSLNVDRAYISNIENGRMNPTLSTLEKIAQALKVSIKELVD